MKTLSRHRQRCLVGLGCLAVLSLAWGQKPGARLTPERLQNRIAAAQDSTELDDSSRARLVEEYRKAISNLESRYADEALAEEYRDARLTAAAETDRIRATLDQRRAAVPVADTQTLSSKSSGELARLLENETAILTAVEAKHAVLEIRIQAAARRPADARSRLTLARTLLEDLATVSGDRSSQYGTRPLAEATRWFRETRLEALRAEIAMLDEELLSHNDRTELLKARRDEAAEAIGRIGTRVEDLRSAVAERRRVETEFASAEARGALAGASSSAPLVREFAQSNLSLVDLLQEQLSELDRLTERERSLPRTSQIERSYRNAQQKLELAGFRTPVGVVILAERRQFPSAGEYSTWGRRMTRSITAVSLRLADNEELRRTLTDIDAYLDGRSASAGGGTPGSTLRGELQDLVRTRRSLLDRAIAYDLALRRRLFDLDDTLHRLTDTTAAYDEYLAKRLLWVRSRPAIDFAAIAGLPGEVRHYLRAGPWLEAARKISVGLSGAPTFALFVLLTLALVWRRGRIRAALGECGRTVGQDHDAGMGSTFKALALTLLWAAPAPLLLAAFAGRLSSTVDSASFATAIGSALSRTVNWIAIPIFASALCLPDGVADRHFGWDGELLARIRRQLAWFIGLVFPCQFVMNTSPAIQPPENAGGMLTFLCFAGIAASLASLVVGISHPTTGAIRPVLARHSDRARWRWRYLGFPVTVSLPLVLIVIGWLGYSYAAEDLTRRIFLTIWCVVAIWLGASLARRWLLLTARRLASRNSSATVQERESVAGQTTTGTGEIGDPEVNVIALGADTGRLLNAFVLLAVALVLAGVWAEIIPALSILDDVSLWDQTSRIDGVPHGVPVTLFDLLLATLTGIAGYILARNVPSLLDIILLKQGNVSVGVRYTVGTLARYAITAIAALVVLNRLGASSLQLGWAAAALGVGIGFGLQEIVANFICGLILLFERPVRVGDVITVGEASGEVTKIRIRATTIRDWERKELVVPNKELITGRLLNWTLSDSVIRILITVGVAYGSDVGSAIGSLREAAEESAYVLDDPEPRVNFEQFGDSSLVLTLRAYTSSIANRLTATTELHQAIDRKFRATGIVIAFPQRDIHVRAESIIENSAVIGRDESRTD